MRKRWPCTGAQSHLAWGHSPYTCGDIRNQLLQLGSSQQTLVPCGLRSSPSSTRSSALVGERVKPHQPTRKTKMRSCQINHTSRGLDGSDMTLELGIVHSPFIEGQTSTPNVSHPTEAKRLLAALGLYDQGLPSIPGTMVAKVARSTTLRHVTASWQDLSVVDHFNGKKAVVSFTSKHPCDKWEYACASMNGLALTSRPWRTLR